MENSGRVTDLLDVWKITPNGVKSIVVANKHTYELMLDNEGVLGYQERGELSACAKFPPTV